MSAGGTHGRVRLVGCCLIFRVQRFVCVCGGVTYSRACLEEGSNIRAGGASGWRARLEWDSMWGSSDTI